jgi:hypothetical protein
VRSIAQDDIGLRSGHWRLDSFLLNLLLGGKLAIGRSVLAANLRAAQTEVRLLRIYSGSHGGTCRRLRRLVLSEGCATEVHGRVAATREVR